MISWSICIGIAQRIRKLAVACIRGNRQRVLVMSLGACGILWTVPVIDASGKPAAPSRPLNASCQTTFAFTPTGSLHIEGTCHYSHLGLTSAVADQIAIPQPDGSLHLVNTAVYTAANGDELFATFVGSGVFTPSGVLFSGTETYHGGTGRFAGATGSAALSGSAEFTSPSAGVGHYSGEGTISY